ncbi:MAG: SgcJ/EcaC family oxidoreductase [Bradymonadales bacterium]|nr:MAG: SgcJ/EcaC family oxidoreductase [Bradymonadales bacterium]
MNREALAVKLFEDWGRALESGDPKKAAGLYAEEAIFFPTFSSEVKTKPQEIEEYFEKFLRRAPRAKLELSFFRDFGDFFIHSGRFSLEYLGADSSQQKAFARFHFLYKKVEEEWKILEHHSSLDPYRLYP